MAVLPGGVFRVRAQPEQRPATPGGSAGSLPAALGEFFRVPLSAVSAWSVR